MTSLPEKIWLKVTTLAMVSFFSQDSIINYHCDVLQKQIAIGINEVTRVLERMNSNTTDQQQNPRPPSVQLQVTTIKTWNNLIRKILLNLERGCFRHR